MTIIYRDNIGHVAVTVENPTEIVFFSNFCMFTDDNGKDYEIPLENLSEIHNLKGE